MNMNVNEKGIIGLIKVKLDLYLKGFTCFTPEDDYNPVDCIALSNDGIPFRIQVKYRAKSPKGKYEISTDSVVNRIRVPINKNLIDCYAIYMFDDDKVVYLPIKDINKSLSFRSELDERFKSIPC